MADKKPEKKETSTEAVKKVDKKLPFFKRIGKWFRDMKQTANNTAVCLVVMFVSALVLWGFDSLADQGVQLLLKLGG